MKIIPNRNMSLKDGDEMVSVQANGKPQEIGAEAGKLAIRMGWATEFNPAEKQKPAAD